MKQAFSLLLVAIGLVACQPSTEHTTSPAATSAAATSPETTDSTIATEAQALEAVDFYLQEMPEGGEYNFDSATVMQANGNWLVLVPSLPGDGRKPNTAAFTVDRHTGDIQVRFLPK